MSFLDDSYLSISLSYLLHSDSYPLHSDSYPLHSDSYPLHSDSYLLLSDSYLLLSDSYPSLDGCFPSLDGCFPSLKGGLLHRPHDSIDLAQKLSFLLWNADLRKRMSGHAQQAAWEKFSSERMAAAMLDVFQRLR